MSVSIGHGQITFDTKKRYNMGALYSCETVNPFVTFLCWVSHVPVWIITGPTIDIATGNRSVGIWIALAIWVVCVCLCVGASCLCVCCCPVCCVEPSVVTTRDPTAFPTMVRRDRELHYTTMWELSMEFAKRCCEELARRQELGDIVRQPVITSDDDTHKADSASDNDDDFGVSASVQTEVEEIVPSDPQLVEPSFFQRLLKRAWDIVYPEN